MNKHEISNKIESLKEELKYGAGEETDFYELGRLYELQFGEKGKYKKTNSQTILDCYNKAIEQNPFYIPAVQKKAEFLCSNGSLSEKTVSEIKNEIENILKVYPANADLQVLLGEIKLFILKDKQGGLENIKKASELDKKYEELLNKKEATLKCQDDLAGKIWADRPQMSKEPVYLLDVKYAGETREDKIARVRKEMEKAGAQVHVLSSLDDIVWLLNIRGNDIEYNPVVLSYVILTMDQLHFYVQEEAVPDQVREELQKAGVVLHPYFKVYEDVKKLDPADKVMLEEQCTNYTLYKNIPEGTEVIFQPNPAAVFKGNKNPVEMENLKIAHIKDARAMCRFIYWLKKNVPGGEVTEYSASMESRKFRMEDPDCLDLSFETICAYGPNAAMCHYAPTETDFAKVEPRGFFLIDSGGQYWQGTTDITRTIAVGELTREQKEHFTLVLQGHIRLAMAKFQQGCSGANLDILVRGPLWARGLDFNHGTGHGVGYLLNVHEGPQNINWKIRVNGGRRGNATPLEEGMLTSDEPGLYLEGKYGIRTENLLLCKKAERNEYGQFMEFETVTLVPYEREAVLPEMLTREELEWLNRYHKKVYETIGPMLTEEERRWLKEATAEIG